MRWSWWATPPTLLLRVVVVSVVEAVTFKVALLVLIFKGLFVLPKVVYGQLEIARILHTHVSLHLSLRA